MPRPSREANQAVDRASTGAAAHHPNKENLFAAVAYDRAAWLRVQQGLDRWIRR